MKNQREMMEALLDGHTLINDNEGVLKLKEDGFVHYNAQENVFNWTRSKNYLNEYKEFEIKQPEPKKIYLYETYNSNMSKILCDKDGHQYNVVDKRRCIGVDSYTKFRKKNIINPDKPAMILNAETWERIDE